MQPSVAASHCPCSSLTPHYIRSFLEYEKRRTMDRALMQIQALLDQHSTRLSVFQSSREVASQADPAHSRLRLLPCLVYPSQYEIKRDLANRWFPLPIHLPTHLFLLLTLCSLVAP